MYNEQTPKNQERCATESSEGKRLLSVRHLSSFWGVCCTLQLQQYHCATSSQPLRGRSKSGISDPPIVIFLFSRVSSVNRFWLTPSTPYQCDISSLRTTPKCISQLSCSRQAIVRQSKDRFVIHCPSLSQEVFSFLFI